jgi:hypothetical protein
MTLKEVDQLMEGCEYMELDGYCAYWNQGQLAYIYFDPDGRVTRKEWIKPKERSILERIYDSLPIEATEGTPR